MVRIKILYNSTNYSSDDFPSKFKNEKVSRTNLDINSARDNPNAHINPLDIVKIFKKCPHCDKKLFLIHKVDLGMYFGSDEFKFHKDETMKDPRTGKFPDDYKGDERHIRKPGGYSEVDYPERHMKEDWSALDVFLHMLQTSHGPLLYASFEEKDTLKLRKVRKKNTLT